MNLSDLEKIRVEKIERMRAAGIEPYPTRSEVTHNVVDAIRAFETAEATAGSDPVQQPLILFREGCAYRARALAWQRSIGHATADVMEFGTLDGILGCVSIGLGWTLMPRRVVEQSVHAAAVVIDAVPPDIGRVPTGLIRRREASPMAALRTLGESLRRRDS